MGEGGGYLAGAPACRKPLRLLQKAHPAFKAHQLHHPKNPVSCSFPSELQFQALPTKYSTQYYLVVAECALSVCCVCSLFLATGQFIGGWFIRAIRGLHYPSQTACWLLLCLWLVFPFYQSQLMGPNTSGHQLPLGSSGGRDLWSSSRCSWTTASISPSQRCPMSSGSL